MKATVRRANMQSAPTENSQAAGGASPSPTGLLQYRLIPSQYNLSILHSSLLLIHLLLLRSQQQLRPRPTVIV